MGAERRQFDRVPEELQMQYRPADHPSDPWRVVPTINLSASGIRFLCQHRIELGTGLDLQLTLPLMNGLTTLDVQAVVAWCSSPAAGVAEVGVEFHNVTPDQQMQLDDFVRFLLSRPKPRSSA